MIKFDLIFYFILMTVGYCCGLFVSYKKLLKNHGPDSNQIRNIKYNNYNKCYKLRPQVTKCN